MKSEILEESVIHFFRDSFDEVEDIHHIDVHCPECKVKVMSFYDLNTLRSSISVSVGEVLNSSRLKKELEDLCHKYPLCFSGTNILAHKCRFNHTFFLGDCVFNIFYGDRETDTETKSVEICGQIYDVPYVLLNYIDKNASKKKILETAETVKKVNKDVHIELCKLLSEIADRSDIDNLVKVHSKEMNIYHKFKEYKFNKKSKSYIIKNLKTEKVIRVGQFSFDALNQLDLSESYKRIVWEWMYE